MSEMYSRATAIAILICLAFVAVLLIALIAAILFRTQSPLSGHFRRKYGYAPIHGSTVDHPRPPKGLGPSVRKGGYVFPDLPAPRVTVVCGGCGNEHLCDPGSAAGVPPISVPRYERIRRA